MNKLTQQRIKARQLRNYDKSKWSGDNLLLRCYQFFSFPLTVLNVKLRYSELFHVVVV